MGTDSLYYIMDYSGHYYRTDKSDQLVAVAGEQDATVFTFAQANSRICVGKKASFYCMVPIEETEEDMSTEASVSNEMDDNSGALHVEEQEENNDDVYISPIKELTYDEVTEPIEKNVASYDLSEMDWAEYLTHFTYLVEGLKDYREELSKKHSDIDQKICDILHYIELCETDDNEAADLVELLRVCRENRRDKVLVQMENDYANQEKWQSYAENNDRATFMLLFEKDFPNMAADRYEQNAQFFRKLFDDPDMMKQVMETVGSVLYERLKKKYIFDPKSGVIEEATPETYVEDTYLTEK